MFISEITAILLIHFVFKSMLKLLLDSKFLYVSTPHNIRFWSSKISTLSNIFVTQKSWFFTGCLKPFRPFLLAHSPILQWEKHHLHIIALLHVYLLLWWYLQSWQALLFVLHRCEKGVGIECILIWHLGLFWSMKVCMFSHIFIDQWSSFIRCVICFGKPVSHIIFLMCLGLLCWILFDGY